MPLLVPGDPWLYAVARLLLVPLSVLYGRLELRGVENVPPAGPAIVVANHPSDLDPLLMGLAVPRTLRFLAGGDHYDRPFVGWCMRRLATVPVEQGFTFAAALGTATGLLRAGAVVVIFWEPDDGEGDQAIRLSCSSGAPLIRVTIEGAEELQWGAWRHRLPGGWLARPRVRVTFGESFEAEPGEGVLSASPGDEATQAGRSSASRRGR